MKKIFLLLLLILSFEGLRAQSHSVNIRLLSTEMRNQFGKTLHEYSSTFEYDNEKRVTAIYYADGKTATIDYSPNQIIATIIETDFHGTTVNVWTMTLENDRVVRDEWVKNGKLYEIYLYTYDDSDQLIHIERQVPDESGRNMIYDIEWTDGQPIHCQETWVNGKYLATHEYIYTTIEDQTLANYYVTPFCYMDNLKDELFPLLYCHNYYGKRHIYLPQGHKQTYSIYRGEDTTKEGWTNTFEYTMDSNGRVNQINDGDGNTVTLIWDNMDTIIKSIKTEEQPSAAYSLDGHQKKTNSKGLLIIIEKDGSIKKIIR